MNFNLAEACPLHEFTFKPEVVGVATWLLLPAALLLFLLLPVAALLLLLCRSHCKTPPTMATRYVTVDAAALGARKQRVRAYVDASTTAMDVVRAVMKQCAVSEMPGGYSLWMHSNRKGDSHSLV